MKLAKCNEQTVSDHTDSDRYVWLLAHMGRITNMVAEWNPTVHKPLLAHLQTIIDREMTKDGVSRDWLDTQRKMLNG